MGEAAGPVAQAGLNEPLRFPIGLWGIGPGKDVADGQEPQRLGEATGSVGAAVIGHRTLSPDALRAEPAQGSLADGAQRSRKGCRHFRRPLPTQHPGDNPLSTVNGETGTMMRVVHPSGA